ncbi:MAG: hypothetical protein JNM84_03630 [Planctomycetes bacterium]|nr:hypothetical protein [Planctomycetota bacterium]
MRSHDPGLSTAELRSSSASALELTWTLAWSDLGGTLGLDEAPLGVLDPHELAASRELLARFAREAARLGADEAPTTVSVESGPEPNDLVLRLTWHELRPTQLELSALLELPRGHRVAFRDLRAPDAELQLLHANAARAHLSVPTAPTEPPATWQPALLFSAGLLLLLVLSHLRR